jgi:hypothetical protein
MMTEEEALGGAAISSDVQMNRAQVEATLIFPQTTDVYASIDSIDCQPAFLVESSVNMQEYKKPLNKT